MLAVGASHADGLARHGSVLEWVVDAPTWVFEARPGRGPDRGLPAKLVSSRSIPQRSTLLRRHNDTECIARDI